LRSGETLKEVLADAGGVTAVAAEARISIERVDQHSAREAMEVAYSSVGMVSPLENGDLIRVYSMTPIYRKTVILRGNTANPGRFAWSPGMRLSDLIPDKESLLTRNYWWKRAQLGLPAPEFQPIAGLENLAQPSANYPVKVPLASLDAMRALRNRAVARQIEDGEEPAPAEAAQVQMGQPIGPQAEASQSQAYLSGNAPGAPQLASQRASDSAIAAEQTRTSGQADFLQPKTDVRLTAPEIDWDYAVIERMDPKTLKTELIPFDLGRLVLDHDASQNLVLQPGDVVTVFSQADIRVPLAQQTKLVRLEGEFVHAGIYSVRPGETLRMLVERAGGLTPNAYLFGSEFTRASTRALQQQRIDEYVQSIKMSIQRGALELVASPAASQKDMASSSLAAGMERDLLASLREIRATGRIVLEFKPDSSGVSSLPKLPLENGDTFVVPSVPSTVNVVGAVYDQNSFLYTPGQRVGAYLRLAGGPNKNADRKHSFLIRADGEVISYAMSRGPWGNQFYDLRVNPGDTVVVPDKTLKPSLLRGVFDYSQLFSQFALGAAALTVIAP
jgi:protein involved in polysaccharide export with SLBB domain